MSRPAARLFDAHLHVIDPAFPLVENQGYLPPAFTVEDYRRAVAGLGVIGGAVVSGSFQAFDQAYLRAALAALGQGFVGVTQLPETVADAELDSLAAAGVRALRFNLRRGGRTDLRAIERMARRVHDRLGWHAEFYADAESLEALAPLIARLPAVAIDHLGLEAAALPTLLPLVESGVRVKATGFGRVDFEVADALQRLHRANPAALMFGTDLPSTRAARPFAAADVDLVEAALGAGAAACVLWKNATDFYRAGTAGNPDPRP
jgi:predicted TIM-barrel fold metal-dependent hydrolase